MLSTAMAVDIRSIQCQMIQRAAMLATGEHGEEAWYLINLFQRTQPRELLRMCHFTLAKFMELNYEYFDEGWPLQSRLEPPSTQASFCRSRLPHHHKRQSRRLQPSRSPSPTRYNRPQITTPDLIASTKASKRRYNVPKLGWLKGKNLLPSKPAMSTPVNAVRGTPQRPSFTTQRPVSSIATSGSPDISPDFFYPWDDTKTSSTRTENSDFTLCRYIIDYMLERSDLLSAEGLFRRPGNVLRTKQLYTTLKDSFAGSYFSVCQPSPPRSHSLSDLEVDKPAFSTRRNDIYCILDESTIYDVASVLLRCLSSAHPNPSASSSHLQTQSPMSCSVIPPKATDLFVQATQLQYHLKDRRPVYELNPCEDWVHLLCHGRQLLAYRIIIQLLLPAAERHLLLKITRLLQKVAANSDETKMTPTALARCLAVAVFGLPDNAESMGSYIDTLTNLIELSEELDTLPAVIYKQVRGFLRSKLGSSPVKAAMDHETETADEGSGIEGTPLGVGQSAMKRSWETCRVNVDLKCPEMTPNEPRIPANRSHPNQENKTGLFAHFCMWPKNARDENVVLDPPVDPAEKRSRALSPFLSWKKQRSVPGASKLDEMPPVLPGPGMR